MDIKNAKYNKSKLSNNNVSISCVMNGMHICVPISEDNTDYAEIQRQVKEKTLTIADAD